MSHLYHNPVYPGSANLLTSWWMSIQFCFVSHRKSAVWSWLNFCTTLLKYFTNPFIRWSGVPSVRRMRPRVQATSLELSWSTDTLSCFLAFHHYLKTTKQLPHSNPLVFFLLTSELLTPLLSWSNWNSKRTSCRLAKANAWGTQAETKGPST